MAKSGLLTFVPGETLKPITVTIKGDTMAEATETFFVNLTNPTNAILSQGTGVASILNDDSRSLQIGRLANHVLLSWSTNSEGFGLLAASAVMPSPAWFGVTNPVTISTIRSAGMVHGYWLPNSSCHAGLTHRRKIRAPATKAR